MDPIHKIAFDSFMATRYFYLAMAHDMDMEGLYNKWTSKYAGHIKNETKHENSI